MQYIRELRNPHIPRGSWLTRSGDLLHVRNLFRAHCLPEQSDCKHSTITLLFKCDSCRPGKRSADECLELQQTGLTAKGHLELELECPQLLAKETTLPVCREV